MAATAQPLPNKPIGYNDCLHLCDVARQIGCVASCNSAYQILLTTRVQQTGKRLTELTIEELLQLIDDCTAEYNARATA